MLGGVLDSGWAIAAGLGRAWFMKPKHNRLLGALVRRGADRRRDLAQPGAAAGLAPRFPGRSAA